MAVLTIVYDSCTLYSAPLRDLLMHLALTDLFRAKWTENIHEEWMRNVLTNRPDLSIKRLEKIKGLMNAHVRDCLIEGHESLIPTLFLPDENDRHVLAAAIHGNADTILTYNLKDFPKEILNQYSIEAQHPDEFIAQLIEASPSIVCSAIHRLRISLKNPPICLRDYLSMLERQSLPRTVSLLQTYLINDLI